MGAQTVIPCFVFRQCVGVLRPDTDINHEAFQAGPFYPLILIRFLEKRESGLVEET